MDNRSTGFICLFRSIRNNPIWREKPYSRGQAMVDLILCANHRPGHARVRGIRIDIERGQMARAERTLADDWGWSRGKVRRFLDELEREQFAALRRDHKITVITILNYDQYQTAKKDDSTANSTTDGPQTGPQTDQNNNEEQVNKKKEEGTDVPSSARTRQTGPAGIDFDFELRRFVGIEERDIAGWCEAYPAVDVRAEIYRAAQWMLANPAKRKKNYRKFLTGWFGRSQERGGSVPSNPVPNGRAVQPRTITEAGAQQRSASARALIEGGFCDGIGGSDRGAPGGPADALPGQ